METKKIPVARIFKRLILFTFLVLVIASIILISISRLHFSSLYGIVLFYDLPQEAVNGEWSEIVVTERIGTIHNSIYELEEASTHVVRAEIVSVRNRVMYAGLDYPHPRVYSIYRLNIQCVYSGEIDEDSQIEIMQIKRLRRHCLIVLGHNRSADRWDSRPHFIRIPLSVGDELILFLRHINRPFNLPLDELWSFHPIQGIYRYTPLEYRENHDNWAFESVNYHNNLTLTVADLKRIKES